MPVLLMIKLSILHRLKNMVRLIGFGANLQTLVSYVEGIGLGYVKWCVHVSMCAFAFSPGSRS